MEEIYTEKLTIKAWAENDRPREKLSANGRLTLSDAELLAIIIGSGNRDESAVELSKRILQQCSNNLNELGKFSVADLMRFNGIGEAKAISIIAALELGRRRKEADSAKKVQITCSKDAYNCIQPYLQDIPYEEFWILVLSRSNSVIKTVKISQGGIAGTVADTRIIFQRAIENLASSIILCHNHPSGNTKPSKEDINLTCKLKEAGVIMDIPVLDHIIYTDNGYFSFADEGVL